MWANSPYAGGTLLTLLAMADWANDEGLCWPSVPTLAKKTRQSVANTRNCIRRMESDGAVAVERMPSAGTSNRYRINIEVLSEIGQRPKQKTKRGGRRGSKTERDQTLEESNRGAGPTKESLRPPPSIGPNTSVDTKDTSPVCPGNLFPEIPSTDDSTRTENCATLGQKPVLPRTETCTSNKEDTTGTRQEEKKDTALASQVVPPPLSQKRKAKKTPLPENFVISDRVQKWAAEHGHIRIQERLEHFIGYCRANGKQYADYDEAFMNAIRGDWAHLNGKKPLKAQAPVIDAPDPYELTMREHLRAKAAGVKIR